MKRSFNLINTIHAFVILFASYYEMQNTLLKYEENFGKL
jgi:hypothetical protein